MKKTYTNRNKTVSALVILALTTFSFTQHSGGIYKTNTGSITFFSHTPVEDIAAENHKVKTAFSSADGKLQFSVLIKDFQFEKALMQEHFNENYMESTTYPKATFSGKIETIDKLNLGKNGTYTSKVSGTLTIKNVAKEVQTVATFKVREGIVNAKATFNIDPTDYNVKIPKAVIKKISDNIAVNIDADYTHQH